MNEARSEATLPAVDRPTGMTFRSVWAFFALTFALSWGIVALLIAFPDRIEAMFGEMGYTNPVFILAVYAPGIIAVLMVWKHYGLTGLGSQDRREQEVRWVAAEAALQVFEQGGPFADVAFGVAVDDDAAAQGVVGVANDKAVAVDQGEGLAQTQLSPGFLAGLEGVGFQQSELGHGVCGEAVKAHVQVVTQRPAERIEGA